MPRPSTSIILTLFSVGALLVLGLAVMLLEGGGQPAPEPRQESGAVVALPDASAAQPVLEGLTRPPSTRARQARPKAPRQVPHRGPLQIIVRVSDRASGKPVPSFQVSILEHTAVAALERIEEREPQAFHLREGIFRVQKDPGSYDVVVMAPGYLPGILADVPIPAENGTALELPLDRGPGIAGTVIDSEGLPRAGIDVYLETLSLRDRAARQTLRTKAVSGVDGRFSFSPLPAGEYAICLLWPNNLDDRIAGIRVAGGTTEVPMRLLARHQVSFRVMNNQDQPLRSARLEIRGAGRYASAATNATGVAVIDNLPDGEYQITVRQNGYRELVEELELVGGLGQHVRYIRLLSDAEG